MSYDAVKALISRGVSRPTLYEVIVDFPAGIASQETNRQLSFLCNRTAVPPAAVNTIAANGHEAMGVVREQPTYVSFNSPFTINVISDRDYTVYKDIKSWYDRIAQNANPYLGFAGPLVNNPLINSGASQRINWYDDFKRVITIKKLELQGGRGTREANSYAEPFRIEFNNAFPVRIGELTLDSSAYDQAMEFTVDFAYETYTFLRDDQIVT